MQKNIAKIRRKLEEQAEENFPYDEIKADKLEIIVEDVAGYHPRTVERYVKFMDKRDMIHKHPAEQDKKHVYSTTQNEGEIITRYKIEKEDEQQEETIDLNGDMVSVTLSMPRELVQKADEQDINKSEVARKALVDAVGNIQDDIREYTNTDLNDTEVEVVREFLDKSIFKAGQDEEKRRNAYTKHFDNYVEPNCEKLRREAFEVAEQKGIINGP